MCLSLLPPPPNPLAPAFPASTTSGLTGGMSFICSDVTFQDDAGVEYVWKNNKPGLAPQLFGPQSKSQPVARFIRSYKDFKVDRENPVVPSALLDRNVELIRDFIVTSFLFRRRETETATVSRAQSYATFGQSGVF